MHQDALGWELVGVMVSSGMFGAFEVHRKMGATTFLADAFGAIYRALQSLIIIQNCRKYVLLCIYCLSASIKWH
jgi:hypothetical protein